MPEAKPTDDLLEAIGPIADALGVATGKVWGIFVKQQIVDGISRLIMFLVTLGAGYVFIAHRTMFGDSAAHQGGFLIIGLVDLLFAFSFLYDALPLLLNPQYGAFEHVRGLLRSQHELTVRSSARY